jgi:hypothetical protein
VRVPPGDGCACGIRFERFMGVPPPNDGIDVSAPLSLSNRHGESSPPPVISPNDGGPPDGIALVAEAPDDRELIDDCAGVCTPGNDRSGKERVRTQPPFPHRAEHTQQDTEAPS